MISFLSSWIEEIAIAVIIASIFEMLIPKGNIKKYIKVTLGIYIVFSIISPFVDSNALYSFNITDEIENYTENVLNSTTSNSNNSTNTETDLEKVYLDTLESQIITAVENQGYIVKSCNVDAVFDTDSEELGIKKIDIVLSGKSSDSGEEDKNEEDTIEVEEVEKVEINVSGSSSSTSIFSSQRITQGEITSLKQYLSEHYEIDRKIINIETK